MATRPKAIIESRNGEKFSPITITKNVLTDDGQNLHDILSNRKEDMMTPTIENSSSMFKVGQGDNVDYSSNVVNGAYESMVLKGKTMVNCIQELSSKDVVLPYAFEDGQSVTINDTKESGALGVELKGQTLKSLYTKTFTLDPKTQYSQLSVAHDKIQIELNKEYTIMIDVYKNNSNCPLSFNTYGHNTIPTNGLRFNAGETGRKIAKVVFTSKQYARWFWFETSIADTTATDSIQCEITVVDGNYVDVVHSHFEGLISCKMPILHTVGKNLATVSNVRLEGIRSNSGGHPKNIIMKNIPVEEGKTYTISGVGSKSDNMSYITFTRYEHQTPTNSNNHTELWNEVGRDNADTTFTIPKGIKYVSFTFGNCVYNNNGEDGWLQWDSIQLEEGSVATAYEPYKSSILSLPEEVVLRSLPNGVCDTFNTKTGEYVQRIGEITLDGNTQHTFNNNNSDNVNVFYFDNIVPNKKFTGYAQESQRLIQCDSLKTGLNFNRWDSTESEYSLANTATGFWIFVPKSIPQSWLPQNPVAVQYELAEPIVTKINLPSTLKSWNTTTHIYSEIPENTLYPILSHSSNPTYPVILKPSTKYSIVANSYDNNHTNSTINFNLGGATASTTVGNRVTTITTPSTLSNELLTMSGRGNKLSHVMVIEGDVVGDEPYFEGMCDSKSPILSNVGKNLVNLDESNPDDLGHNSGNGTSGIEYDNDKQGFYTKTHRGMCENLVVKPNTYYTISADFLLRDNNGYSFLWHNPTQSAGDTYNSSDFSPTEWRRKSVTRLSDENGKINWVVYGGVYFKNLQVEEGTTATPYEPYKSNILSCNGDKIELTEDMFEQGHGGYNSSVIGSTYDEFKSVAIPSYQAIRVRSKSLVKVKPNTTYFIKADSTKYNFGMQGFDNNKLSIGYDTYWQTDHVFTTPADMYYASLHIRKNNDGSLTPANVDYNCIQLSEVDKTIVLRSLPNGVCDTLNVETGEYVQRIGDYTVNGTETSWFTYIDTTGVTNNYLNQTSCAFGIHLTGKAKGNGILCDKLPTRSIGWWGYEHTGEGICGIEYDNRIFLRVKNEKTGVLYTDNGSTALEKAKTYLASNPVTVQYELATPIVSTIDVQGFPYAYANGHVILSSGSIEQSLTPKVEYSVTTNRNGQIRSNQKMVERHQKQLDRLQAMILTNLVNTQYEQTLTNLKYDLKNVREEVK